MFYKHHIAPQLCLQASWPVDRQNVRFWRNVWPFQGYQDVYNFEPPTKRVTDSINYEELAAASADVHLEQPPVPSTSEPDPHFVCVRIILIDKSTHWVWMRIFVGTRKPGGCMGLELPLWCVAYRGMCRPRWNTYYFNSLIMSTIHSHKKFWVGLSKNSFANKSPWGSCKLQTIYVSLIWGCQPR